jgi:hypothetical protein
MKSDFVTNKIFCSKHGWVLLSYDISNRSRINKASDGKIIFWHCLMNMMNKLTNTHHENNLAFFKRACIRNLENNIGMSSFKSFKSDDT